MEETWSDVNINNFGSVTTDTQSYHAQEQTIVSAYANSTATTTDTKSCLTDEENESRKDLSSVVPMVQGHSDVNMSFEQMVKQTHKIVIELKRKQELKKANKAREKQKKIKSDKDEKDDKEKMLNRLSMCEEGIQLLTNVGVKQDKQLQSLNKHIDHIKAASMKANVIITGIIEVCNEDSKDAAQQFFKEQLGMEDEANIKDAYRIGKNESTRPLLVAFDSFRDKLQVLKKAKGLKGKTNKDGDSFYIRDHLQEKDIVKERCKWYIVSYNKTLIKAQQQSLERKKGQLLVENKPYESKIKEPTISEILKMNPDQVKKVLKHRMYEGDPTHKQGSTFVGLPPKSTTWIKSLKCICKCTTALLMPHTLYVPIAYLTPILLTCRME